METESLLLRASLSSQQTMKAAGSNEKREAGEGDRLCEID